MPIAGKWKTCDATPLIDLQRGGDFCGTFLGSCAKGVVPCRNCRMVAVLHESPIEKPAELLQNAVLSLGA
jgi:hypothetical protein